VSFDTLIGEPAGHPNMNRLYYDDNLTVLRGCIDSESVDLIYLDPPFNSQATYNVLFRSTAGEESRAQIEAFEDTWHWGDEAELAFDGVMVSPNSDAAELLRALRAILKETDIMAYLCMMAVRIIELHRVLKPTGSLYLHCDPAASHYLKIILDGVFGASSFRSEIIWRRTNSHNKLNRQYGPIHDTILFYGKTDDAVFHPATRPYTRAYIEDRFTHTDAHGRYQTNYLTGPGVRKGESGKEWRGFNPTKAGRHWAVPLSLREFLPNGGKDASSHEQLEALYSQNLIVFPKKSGGQPMYKQYVGAGVPYQDIWAYQPNTSGVLYESKEHIDQDVKYLEDEKEKLGYQTQKPVGLLERIIRTSSDEGATILDPFCGCGTTIHAAQKLKRQWIGIDITHLAISLIEKRLKDAFPGIQYEVHGTPTDLDGARDLAARSKHEFQLWAGSRVNAVPFRGGKKGADSGIDGLIYFKPEGKTTEKAIVTVKGGENVNVAMVRDLAHVVDRENAKIGVFITLAEPTGPMKTEAVKAGFYKTLYGKYPKIQILTIRELFDGKQPKIPLVDPAAFKKAAKEKVGHQNPLPF
jgi:site-specific DNA-methyltransferase (adenine-specific)